MILIPLVAAMIGIGTIAALNSPSSEKGPEKSNKETGVTVETVRLSASGYMLDFRFRVSDPIKAAAVLDRKTKPLLIHERSGSRLFVPVPPKVGPMRQTTMTPEAGRNYYVLFANPSRFIKKGDAVTVVYGEMKLEHLTVQ